MFSKKNSNLPIKMNLSNMKFSLKTNITSQTNNWQECQQIIKKYKSNQIIERAHGGEKFYDNGEDITDQILRDYVTVTNNIKNLENVIAYEKQLLTKLQNKDASLTEIENNIKTIMQNVDFVLLKNKRKKIKKYKNIQYLAKQKSTPLARMAKYEAGLFDKSENNSNEIIELKNELAQVIDAQKEIYKKLDYFKEIKNSNVGNFGLYEIKIESKIQDDDKKGNSVQYVPLSYINKNIKFYQEQYEKLCSQEKDLREKINKEKNN